MLPAFPVIIFNMKNSSLILIFTLTMLIFTSFVKISAQTNPSQSRGIYNITELNIGYGLQGDVEPNEIGFAGLSTIVGYTFTRSLSAGLGVGILAYNGSNCVPLYGEAGYYFRNFGLGKMRFFLKADGGLLIRLNGDVSPTRVFGNPAAGMLIPVAHHKEISVSFGWFTQWDTYNEDETKQNQLTNFINAKVGLRFY